MLVQDAAGAAEQLPAYPPLLLSPGDALPGNAQPTLCPSGRAAEPAQDAATRRHAPDRHPSATQQGPGGVGAQIPPDAAATATPSGSQACT